MAEGGLGREWAELDGESWDLRVSGGIMEDWAGGYIDGLKMAESRSGAACVQRSWRKRSV